MNEKNINIAYYYNITCDGCSEVCFYDASKYTEEFAFGNEFYIEIDTGTGDTNKLLEIIKKDPYKYGYKD